jgi:hypothetical protein
MNIAFIFVLCAVAYKIFYSTTILYKRILRTSMVSMLLTGLWVQFAIPHIPANLQIIDGTVATTWLHEQITTKKLRQKEMTQQIVSDFTNSADVENRGTHSASDAKTNTKNLPGPLRDIVEDLGNTIDANNTQREAYIKDL